MTINKKFFFFNIFLFVFFAFYTSNVSAATTVIVDKNSVGGFGCNDTWPGTLTQPICTINKAQSLISPGGTVYVRGGTYNAKVNITAGSGTSTAPVMYMPYWGESVKIDGTGMSLSADQALVNFYGVSYITFKGFEVLNSKDRGITADAGNFITIQGNAVHETQSRGIGVSGTNITIDSNTVYHTVLSNTNDAFGGSGWSQAISTWMQPNGSASKNITFTNNTIYDSWGEGIDVIAVDGANVSGNRIHDTYSVLIYMDNSRNVTLNQNYLSATNSTYFRGGKPANGIMFSAESCCTPSPTYPIENLTISNNLIVNAGNALQYWSGDFNNPYKSVKIYYNTIKDTKGSAIYFDSISTSGNELRDNIIYGSVTIPNAASWIFSNNNWPGGKPGIDNSGTSFSADPLFVNAVAGGSADGYKLQASSTSIGKGVTVSVTNDYFGDLRKSPSTVGFYEYSNTSVIPTPSAIPQTKIGDINSDGHVDILDIGITIDNYARTGTPGFISSDINRDGIVNIVDIGVVIDNYGK